MIVLSHRGYWKTAVEKNTPTAFKRSFELGFGTETDVRDRNGELVISHDMPNGSEITLAADPAPTPVDAVVNAIVEAVPTAASAR